MSELPPDDDQTPREPPAEQDHNLARLGHKRPWWQWNLITLFVALFALVWAREIWLFPGEITTMILIAILIAWFLVPLHDN